MTSSSLSTTLLRWLERMLYAVGIVCLGLAAFLVLESSLYQQLGRWELHQASAASRERQEDGANLPQADPLTATAAAKTSARPVAPGTPLGTITIPEVDVDAVILAGVDDQVLRRGVGHFPQAAMPGEGGNIALAAHRDTFFRGLRDIENGHEILISTADGRERKYRVVSTEIVEPTRVDVLDDIGREVVTLITCHPFSYVGPAPRRFVVRGVPQPSIPPSGSRQRSGT